MDFLFKGLSAAKTAELLSGVKLHRRQLLRGETLFLEGDYCNYLSFINSGCIVAKNIFADGHESIVRVLSNNDTIGEALLFSNDNRYKATFISDTKTVITLISYDDLVSLVDKSSTVCLNLLNKISNNVVSLNNHVRVLSKKTIKSKLCEYLYFEYLKCGCKTFSLALNKTELALQLNVERPSLSSEIKALVEEGVIANVANSYTIVDLSKLEKYL